MKENTQLSAAEGDWSRGKVQKGRYEPLKRLLCEYSVVLQNVPAGATAVDVPAMIIRRTS